MDVGPQDNTDDSLKCRTLVGCGPAERACFARRSSYCRTRGRGRQYPGLGLSCFHPGRRTTGGLTLPLFS